ncbi:MAG: cytochrome c [Candidatus Thiodiazotropha lotti]|uniref:Cytochrome c domain-containing protein n=1 Tax=Candidatus Thiodiazotropha endoloripes TaxID=1818881 RepID=A0A1E2UNS7_9GAMM|nr:cytochrome c [Candidatus Thiodiazotropha endoloripes]MCG7899912.1 cytochrome c [Candidatus Thiodiazotropha weberae]MCG7993380.1 cytochrome c [Candidatus Thiodiazotropha lotti]MCG7901050.1 cytochrome c [Candidatus Thiodiazotropha weberae]MCG7913351.1 cytochrome c [Candidatus Thiodiazotropha weberae]MCG7998102.1 cytochrome c [Candidatus Thiodiazotropha lotti]
MKKTTYLSGVSLLALSLSGCSDSNDFKPITGMDGMDIYANACASCHGENGQGKFGLLLKLADSEASPEEISAKIINGGQLMPAFPNISQAQAEQIAAYLKAQ